jgi:hypothetical protein
LRRAERGSRVPRAGTAGALLSAGEVTPKTLSQGSPRQLS